MRERDFQRAVVQLAETCGWLVYHVSNVRGRLRNGSAVGFPDLVLARAPDPPIFAELKTEKGKLHGGQQDWLNTLDNCGADVKIWRPSDWPEIEAVLTHRT